MPTTFAPGATLPADLEEAAATLRMKATTYRSAAHLLPVRHPARLDMLHAADQVDAAALAAEAHAALLRAAKAEHDVKGQLAFALPLPVRQDGAFMPGRRD